MPELVWVTQGKTEHLATLLGTLGVEGQETVEIRWESTHDKEFVPVNTVRRDEGRRRRRTGPTSYAESPSSPQPNNENALISKTASRKRRRRNENISPETQLKREEDRIVVISQSRDARLKQGTAADGEKKAGINNFSGNMGNDNVKTPLHVAQYLDEMGGEKINGAMAIDSSTTHVRQAPASQAPLTRDSGVKRSHDALVELGDGAKDGIRKQEQVHPDIVPGQTSAGRVAVETVAIADRSKKRTQNDPAEDDGANLQTRKMELGLPVPSVGVGIFADEGRTRARHFSADLDGRWKRQTDEPDDGTLKEKTNPLQTQGEGLKVQEVVATGNDMKHTRHNTSNATGKCDSTKMAHTGRSSESDFCMIKRTSQELQAIHQSHRQERVPPEVVVPVPKVIPLAAQQQSSEKAGKRGNNQITIASPPIVVPLQVHFGEHPQNVGDPESLKPQLMGKVDAYGIMETIGTGRQSIMLPDEPTPLLVVKEISNDENTQSSSKQDVGDSSDDDAVGGIVNAVHSKRGKVNRTNIAEVEIRDDSPDTLIAHSSEKNNKGPRTHVTSLVAPKKANPRIEHGHSNDDDVIARSIKRCNDGIHPMTSPTPSPRGFEKELSKQQRLFLAEVSGEGPADSLDSSRSIPKEKKVRINKENWNKIEKLKQGRGSDDDSVPGLRADKQ